MFPLRGLVDIYAGFYLEFKIWGGGGGGGGGGGEAIIDNAAVGSGYRRGMCPFPHEA